MQLKEIESIRFNHLRQSSRREGVKEIKDSHFRQDDFVLQSDNNSPQDSSRAANPLGATMNSIDTYMSTDTTTRRKKPQLQQKINY